MDNKDKDLFKEAQQKAIENLVVKDSSNLPTLNKDELLPIIKERVEDGETQWDLLARMIDGSFTERFIRVMDNMGDKDFARNYLKLLEHFKPKVTRTEGGDDLKDNKEVVIRVKQLNLEGIEETIDITGLQDFENGLQK